MGEMGVWHATKVPKCDTKPNYNLYMQKNVKHTQTKTIARVSVFVFIYLKYIMHCQARINITVVKVKAEVLWYIT